MDMTQEQFEAKLRDIFMPNADDPEFTKRKSEAVNIINAAILDTIKFAGGTWKNDVASERFVQWEWLGRNIKKQPKPDSMSESKLHTIYKDYLKERGYLANKLPTKEGKLTPDFLIEGNSLEILNEFKAPELIFNNELNVYKFQTTHSKILSFISKSVKQLNAEDPKHKIPWVVTFAPTHFQLNWNSFLNTLRGGVPYDDKLMPDFTNTDVFKRVIVKAKEIDLYIWLQVNPNRESIIQVSFFVREDSKFIDIIKKFITDLRLKDVGSMDQTLNLTWPNI